MAAREVTTSHPQFGLDYFGAKLLVAYRFRPGFLANYNISEYVRLLRKHQSPLVNDVGMTPFSATVMFNNTMLPLRIKVENTGEINAACRAMFGDCSATFDDSTGVVCVTSTGVHFSGNAVMIEPSEQSSTAEIMFDAYVAAPHRRPNAKQTVNTYERNGAPPTRRKQGRTEQIIQ